MIPLSTFFENSTWFPLPQVIGEFRAEKSVRLGFPSAWLLLLLINIIKLDILSLESSSVAIGL